MAGVELTNGVVVNGGPPEGEQGSLDPDGAQLFASFNDWDLGQSERVTERQFSDMLERDGKAASIEAVLTLPLRWAGHSIEPQEGDSGEAEFATEALTTAPEQGGMSTPLDHVIAQIAGAAVFRRAFFEKVWRAIEGRVAYRKLAFRPASSCTLIRDKQDGSFAGFKQRVLKDGGVESIKFGPEKAFVYVHDQARAPLTGRSAMESVYRAYESKQKVRFLWFAFLEGAAGGWALAKDENGDPAQGDALARKLSGLKSGGVVGLGKGQSAELLTPGDSGEIFKDCLDWLSAEMSASVLASFTDLAQQGSGRGSYALSADQSDFFLRSRQATLIEMGAAITTYAVSDLIRWNFGPAGKVPTFKFNDLADHHGEAVRELFSNLATHPQANPAGVKAVLDELIVRVAGVLELDVDKVASAIQTSADQPATEQLQSGLDAAARLVAEAGLGGGGLAATPPAAEPVEASSQTPAVQFAAPRVEVRPPDVHVHPPEVNVHATIERGGAVRIVRDEDGQVVGAEPQD